MRCCGIPDFIYSIKNCIQSCVITYCSICSIKVVINSSRKSDTRNIIFFCQQSGTSERTITTYYYKSINTLTHHSFMSHLTSLRSFELHTSRSLQDCTSQLYDIAYILSFKFLYFSSYKSFIASINSLNFQPVVYCCTSHGTNSRIHTRSISSRSEDTNTFNTCHIVEYY